jgi:hypothetical protein
VNSPLRFVFNDRMWITSSRGALFSTADGRDWSLATDQAPWTGRLTAGTAVFRGRMWVIGGRQKSLRNDVWSSADGVNWQLELAEAPWSRRQLWDNLVVFDDKLWVIGGGIQSYNPFRSYRDVWCSGDGRHWEQVLEEAPWPARNWGSTAVYRNRMWVLAGFQPEPSWRNLNDVWYSADGAEWHQLTAPQCWSPRHEISPYVFREKLWVVGGNAWPLQNDAWTLDIPGLSFVTQPLVEDFATAQYTYRARADFHPSRRPLRYRLLKAPPWLKVDEATGVVRGILPEVRPPATDDGSHGYEVELEASDGAGETAAQAWTLHVIP